MWTYPNYASWSDNDLRKEFARNEHMNAHYHKIGWHEKASYYYGLNNMVLREMTKRHGRVTIVEQ